jgi:hypothetical protein
VDGSAVVVRSTDRGATWTVRSTIPASASGANVRGRVSSVWHHPSQSGVLFLCTQGGLFRSTDGGASWTRMNGTGSLPVGEVVRVDINPANGNEIYCTVNASPPIPGNATPASLGLWRTTNGGTAWTEISIPSGFPPSKVFVGFADGGGWQPVGSRTLYLIGRGPQLQVSQNGGSTWAAASVSPRPGMDNNWNRTIRDSDNGSVRPEIIARILPHPHIAKRAFAHASAHNFRTDDAVSWRYSGEGFSGEIAFVTASSIAFSNDPLRMAFGITDAGYRITEDGGRSFHVGRVNGHTETGEALKNSSHSIAIHPTNPNLILVSAGFRTQTTQMRLFRSERHFPGDYIGTRGDLGVAVGNSPWVRVRDVNDKYPFLHWNRDTPTVVYANSVRSLDSGVTWQGYAAGFGGARAVFPGDNDIVYGLTKSGNDHTLRRSNDRGASIHSTLVTIPWNGILPGDLYYAVLAIHPTDPAIVFTVGSTGDLARYDGNTGTWKTDYGLLGRHVANHPGAQDLSVSSIALDPQDANVGYVGIRSYGFNGIWRSLNIQAANPDWEDVTLNFHRVSWGPKLVVHPLTGDIFAGTGGVGGVRMLPPPGRRSHPSLIGNGSAL